MVRKFLLVILLINLFVAPAAAGDPRSKIKFKNIKIEKKDLGRLNRAFKSFLDQNRQALLKADKDYTVDQYCSFEAQANINGGLDIDSLKLAKHKNNFAYNLKALEFLQAQSPLPVEIKSYKKPIVVKLYYYSF